MPRASARYKTEFTKRDQQAMDRGFSSYGQERRFKELHREEIDAVGDSWQWENAYGSDEYYRRTNPAELVAFYNAVVGPEHEYTEGTLRHMAYEYAIEQGWSEDEALAFMRSIYGMSGEQGEE